MNSLDHVWSRHRFGSHYPDVSRFSSAFKSKSQIKGLLTDALNKGNIKSVTQTADGGREIIVEMSRTIGRAIA
jgi:hypothetical protein